MALMISLDEGCYDDNIATQPITANTHLGADWLSGCGLAHVICGHRGMG